MTSTLAYIPSPPQGVWQLGPFPLRAYALCIIVGIVVALVLGDRRWEARGGERGVIYDIALWAVPFGLIGGRLYHVITDWRTYFGPDGAGLVAAFRIWEGGLGIWGAVALGGVGAWIACRRRNIPLPAFGDAIAPGIILAQAIGRLGNYFNQELYGGPTTLPWGLEIYERLDASGRPNDLIGVSTGRVIEVVHPTFLYELLWNLLVFAVLIWADRRFKLGHGRLFALYVAGYCLGRFWIELLRSDMATHLAGIRVNSFTSMFVFIGAVVYLMVAPRGREDPARLRGDVEEPVEAKVVVPEDFEADAVEPDASEEEDAATAELLKGVAATTGVGIAATAAGDAEDEDAETVSGEADDEATTSKAEAVAEAEALTEDVESAPSEEIAEAVAFAEAGEAAEEQSAEEVHEAAVEQAREAEAVAAPVTAEDGSDRTPSVKRPRILGRLLARNARSAETPEAVVEAEALTEDVESAPSEDIAEAVAFADAGEAADREPVTTVGSVEGEDAVAAEESAEEAHEAAVERAEEAEAVAEEAAVEEAQPEVEAADGEPLTTVGAVEGEDAVAAEESAEEAHEAAVERAEEAEAVAKEVAVEEAHEAAVELAEEAKAVAEEVAAQDERPESEAEAVADEAAVEEAQSEVEAADGGPLTTVGAVEGEDAVAAEESAEEAHEAAVERAEEAEAIEAAADDSRSEDLEEAQERADEAESVAEEIAVADATGEFADEQPVATESEVDSQEETEPGDDADATTDSAAYRIVTAPEPDQQRRRWWRRRK